MPKPDEQKSSEGELSKCRHVLAVGVFVRGTFSLFGFAMSFLGNVYGGKVFLGNVLSWQHEGFNKPSPPAVSNTAEVRLKKGLDGFM